MLCKSLGSSNHINVARATIAGLKALQAPRRDRPPAAASSPEEFVPEGPARGLQGEPSVARTPGRGALMAELKVTQVQVGDRRQAQAARHAARPRPRPHRPDQHPARPPRDPGHDRPGPAPRHRRGGASRESRVMKSPRPAARPGLAPARQAGRPRHRRQGRQDRRPRHQGPEGPRHRPRGFEGGQMPLTAGAQAEGLQQPVPRRVPGHQPRHRSRRLEPRRDHAPRRSTATA